MSPSPVPWVAIEPLNDAHPVSDFTCGDPDADAWIQEKAANERNRVTTHVASEANGSLAGYYALRTVAVLGGDMSNSMRGSAADKTAFLLCWIAVHADRQGNGHFPHLLRESWRTAVAAGDLSPVDLFVLDPLSPELATTYEKFGLIPIKPGSKRMGIKMTKVRQILEAL